MTAPDSGSWWTSATAPRTPLEAIRRARRAANTPPPVEEPGTPGIADISAMSQAQYAAARDSVLAEFAGGPKSSSDYQGVEQARGRAGLMLDADQMAALMPWRTQGDRPVSGRPLDPDYQQAQIQAQQNTGLAVPRYTSEGS